jgi:hypothetical protein
MTRVSTVGFVVAAVAVASADVVAITPAVETVTVDKIEASLEAMPTLRKLLVPALNAVVTTM